MNKTEIKSAQNGTHKSGSQNRVKAKPNAAQGLRGLFTDELKDIYWPEKELTEAIPKMIENATADELAEALTGHLEVTREHVTRLEKVFSSIGEKAVEKKCEAMEGLMKEAEEIMEHTKKGMVRDAGIISAAQKVEHYEIATYGTLCTFAKTLGENEAASLLHETLEEEKEADEKLSEIAESFINVGAADADEEEAHDNDGDTMVAIQTKRK
ncbi:MAG: ferritin-like domain-containing protein [Bacteroidia bacterium]|nr:ferritin-like domain-containing protein [Bacteroidia bacterium]